ncbi:2Fe-2S ferredoxin [Paratrimastix pyriformis]|uniref:2Fe-2S ferredoxin n=1 Tax=Paratrimastix pyriformis TaxID=342808 RepID=A0ABQ8UVQ9_9EUKA|nr:2Fe-2S ferredoxin [Paratrimastix pyriformis]
MRRGPSVTAAVPMACDRLRCTGCDFRVLSFSHKAWRSTVDYLFFRNSNLDPAKLSANLIDRYVFVDFRERADSDPIWRGSSMGMCRARVVTGDLRFHHPVTGKSDSASIFWEKADMQSPFTAAVLGSSLTDRFLSSVTIHFLTGGQKKTVSAEIGASICNVARENGIDIQAACQGHGMCGSCAVTIDRKHQATLSRPSNQERKTLSRQKSPKGVRLACQTLVTPACDGMEVRWG